MASAVAASRLRKELTKFRQDPPPGVIAEPKESDILTWFFALRGPVETPYAQGVYVGKLVFPREYPMKPPSILILTPSGRFVVNTRICMSMSDFHPESWNPLWSVATILQGVVSFMASEELTTGGMRATTAQRKQYATASHGYNAKHFGHLFDGDITAAMEASDQVWKDMESKRAETAQREEARKPRARRVRRSEAKEEETSIEQGNDKEDLQQVTQQLSEAEIEKRRKKNAKKRAKQKAKKAAAKEEGQDDDEA